MRQHKYLNWCSTHDRFRMYMYNEFVCAAHFQWGRMSGENPGLDPCIQKAKPEKYQQTRNSQWTGKGIPSHHVWLLFAVHPLLE